MKAGDVVANVDTRGCSRHALIARGVGDPDKHVLLVFLDGSFARTFPCAPHCYAVDEERSGEVLITEADAKAFMLEIIPRLDRLLVERKERERASGIRTFIDERGRRTERMEGDDGMYRGVTPSSRGHGGSLYTQEPLRLAERDRPSRWSKAFYKYLTREEEPYHHAVFDLESKPEWYDIYVRHAHDGEKLVEIAAQVGISRDAVYKRWQRGKAFVKKQKEAYEGIDNVA